MNILIIEIISSILIVIIVLYTTKFVVKNKKSRKYIQDHTFLHPNSISYFRIPLWLLSIILYHYWFEFSSIMIFVFASITDASDWIIARWCNLITHKGKSLDPLADKLVYFSPLLYFWYIWKIHIALVIIFIVIDIFWQFSRLLLNKFKNQTWANLYWKIKTIFIFILIFYLMIFENKNIIDIKTFYINIFMLIWIIFALLSIIFKFIHKKQ